MVIEVVLQNGILAAKKNWSYFSNLILEVFILV